MSEEKKTNYLEDKEARAKHIAEISGQDLLSWLLAFYQRDRSIGWGSEEFKMMQDLEAAVVARMSPPLWHHLDTDKPGDGEECCVSGDGMKYGIATYSAKLNLFYGNHMYGCKPRFWLPLPPAPQEKE